MTTDLKIKNIENEKSKFPLHGWLGLGFVTLFWILNWTLPGARTHWGFFPLWLAKGGKVTRPVPLELWVNDAYAPSYHSFTAQPSPSPAENPVWAWAVGRG